MYVSMYIYGHLRVLYLIVITNVCSHKCMYYPVYVECDYVVTYCPPPLPFLSVFLPLSLYIYTVTHRSGREEGTAHGVVDERFMWAGVLEEGDHVVDCFPEEPYVCRPLSTQKHIRPF